MLDLDDPRSGARYRRAGLVYGVLGATILALSALSPALLRPERRADLAHLLVGLPFFVLFALAIAYGDRAFAAVARLLRATPERATDLGAWWREKLVMVLAISALGRTAVFFGNGLGQRPRLGTEAPWLAFETVEPEARMLVAAALMAIICAFLVAASWLPAIRRWRGDDAGDVGGAAR